MKNFAFFAALMIVSFAAEAFAVPRSSNTNNRIGDFHLVQRCSCVADGSAGLQLFSDEAGQDPNYDFPETSNPVGSECEGWNLDKNGKWVKMKGHISSCTKVSLPGKTLPSALDASSNVQ